MDTLSRKSFITGCVFLFLAVALGAMASHVIKAHLGPGPSNTFEIAARYQFYHGLGLLILGLINHLFPSKWFVHAFWLFLFGIIFFSGSLYLLALKPLFKAGFISIIGPITPIGGLCFMLGWLLVLIGIVKR